MKRIILSDSPWPDYGNFLFTTSKIIDSRVLWPEDHLKRLARSVKEHYRMKLPFGLLRYLKSSSFKRSAKGSNKLRIAARKDSGELLIEISTSIHLLDDRPLRVLSSETGGFLLRRLNKGFKYDFFSQHLNSALEKGFDEKLFCREENLIEGSYGSFLGFRGNEIIIPKRSWIESITLKKIIAFLVANHGYQLSRQPLTLSSLSSLESVLHLNSFRLARPVALIQSLSGEILFEKKTAALFRAVGEFNKLAERL